MSYKLLKNTWVVDKIQEKFFVSYAVRGPMVVPSLGLRMDMPVNYPICGPVSEPSPLNNRWVYSLPEPTLGVL